MKSWARVLAVLVIGFVLVDPALAQRTFRQPLVAVEETTPSLNRGPVPTDPRPDRIAAVLGVPVPYATITAALAAAGTGDTIEIAPGTYAENVIVNKSVLIRGAGAGVTVINPAFTDPAFPTAGTFPVGHSTMFLIQSHNVTIEKLTMDGDNTSLPGGQNVGGANIDARNGVVTDHTLGVINNLTIRYATVKNIWWRALYASSGGTFYFHDNVIQNVQGSTSGSMAIFNWAGAGTVERDTVLDVLGAIVANHSRGMNIINNVVNNSWDGVHSDNGGDGGGVADTIRGNILTNSPLYGYGIWVFVPYLAPVIENNTVTNVDIGLGAFAGAFGPTVTATFTNNLIDGQSKAGSVGFYITNTTWGYGVTDVAATLTDNEFTNNDYGMFIESAAGKTVTMSANRNAIHTNAVIGVDSGAVPAVYGNPGGLPGTLAVSLTTNWWGSNTGPLNATTNPSGTGNGIDDGIDYSPWWGADYRSVAHPWNWHCNISNGSTIQEAVTAATAGDVIYAAANTFNERVTINKSLTLQGAGETTTILDGTGLVGAGSGITINNGITNVTIRDLTVRNYAGTSPNSYAGIYGVGGNNTLFVQNVTLKDNVGGSGFYANGPVNGITLDNLDVSGHTNAFGVARGIVIWNGLKQNITITNSDVYNNNCCGIELQDGTASGVTIQNNNIYNNGDNGIGLTGMEGPGENLVRGNTVTDNGRFGIEVKNPNGSGLATGPGRIVVDSNNVSRTLPIGAEVRDLVGIAAFRRGVLIGNVDIPYGVVIQNNTVSGYVQPSNSDGFGIVAEGMNHTVSGNTVTGCDVGIQRQAGHLPYPGDGDQSNLADQYFGRGNSPVSCGIILSGNTLSSNGVNTRDVGPGVAAGIVENAATSKEYCTIQSAINDPLTLNGHTLDIYPGIFNERVSLTKSLTLLGADEATTILDGAGLPGVGSGITIAVNLTNVTIRNLTVRNYAGSGPNSYAGIYAIGQNNNLLVRNVTIKDNLGGSGFYANGPVNGVTLDSLDVSGHTNIAGAARGIVIWNGLKENITVTNSSVYNNNCCGIELQDGTASGVTIQNNNIYNNGDNGIGVVGMQAPGENLIRGNTLLNNGRFGIEVKNPSGSGLATGPGRIVVDSNNVSRTLPIGVELRDLVGIAAFRRGVLAGNVDIPVGVVIQYNTVSGYVQPSNSDGFGIVAEGINHIVSGNNVSGCDVGIQRQSGHLPYSPFPPSVDGDQSNLADQYFGRGNSPVSCGITLTGNTLSNTVDTRDVPGAIALKTGYVKNTTTDSLFCTIQSAINAPNTVAGHTLAVNGGTYDEQVLVNKGVTIKGVSSPLPTVDFTGVVSGKPALFDISVDAVTVDSIHFNVDLSKLRSAIIASAVALDNITITNNVVDAYGTPAGSYGDRNAVSINYSGTTNYRVAAGGVDNILFQGNTVNGSLPSSFFRSAVSVDEAGGTFSGNTLQTINHDVLVRFGSNGNINVTGNFFNGGGVELADMNAGAGVLTVSGNAFDGTMANIAAAGTAVLRLKNNYNSKTTNVTNNTFVNHEWAVSLENYNSVTLDNNGFTPLAGSTGYHHVAINTKSITTNSNAIVQVPVAAVLTNNTFNWSGTFGGTALGFYNHDNDAASFGAFTVGTAGNENTFNNGIANTIYLDAESGPSNGTAFPNYNSLIGVGAPAITTKAPWATNIDGTNNEFDVGSGVMLPGAMTLANLYDLEDRIVHRVDVGTVGVVTVVSNHRYVTSSSFFAPATVAPHIQRGVDAANGGDTVNVAPGQYRGQMYINKDLALLGSGRAVTEIVPPVALMNQPFLPARLERPIIGVDSLGTNVIVDGFTVDGEGAGNTHGNMVGVQYFKGSGIVRNNTIKRIRPTPFGGSQTNAGILVNHAFPAVYNHTVEIHDDSVYDFGKTGIVCNHPGVVGNVHDNVVIGQGPVGAGFAAQNGIQFGFGATGTVSNNHIEGFSYTGGSFTASSILGVATDGIMTISDNTIVEGQVGVNLQQSGSYPGGSSSGEVYGNTFTASTAGTGVPTYYGAITWSEGGALPPEGNRPLPPSAFDEEMVAQSAAGSNVRSTEMATMTVDLADNVFTSTTAGAGAGLYMLALATSPQTVTGDSNTFSGFEVAIVADKDPGASLNSTWRRNSFVGNTYGIYDLTGVLQDARENWWNDATGPADPKSLPATPNYNNPGGMGDSVTAFIDYNPWYTDAAKTSLSYYTISVNTVGNGSVTKSPDTTAYVYFADVLLTAVPDPGWHFVGWSGDTTSVDNPITITVIGDMNYTATFAINQYPINLTISGTGSGSVAKVPDQPLYDHGTPVILTGNADFGSTFIGWLGDTVTASNPITVVMNDTLDIEAIFALNAYTLNVAVVGSGAVAKNPDFPLYDHGMTVGLKATPVYGHHFVGWTGDTTSVSDTLFLTMTGNVNLTATFAINQYPLNVTISGGGSVGKLPDLPLYDHGTNVTLTATPFASWNFLGWTGDTTTTNNPITLLIEDTVNVTALFEGEDFLTVSPETLIAKSPVGKLLKPVRRGRNLYPNWANLMEEVVVQGGFQPGATESDTLGGLVVGVSHMEGAGTRWKPVRDSARVYCWVRISNWDGNRNRGRQFYRIQRTLEDRSGVHDGDPHGLDVFRRVIPNRVLYLTGQRRVLPPKTHTNKLFAEMVALKFNIAASQLGKTPVGFGELLFNQPGHIMHGKMIREISSYTDTAMTYWRGRTYEEYDSLHSAIYRINRAFIGALDTISWEVGGKLTLAGAVNIADVPFLAGSPVPPIILRITTDETEDNSTDFDDDEEFLDENGVPVAVKLDQNYPNPFNPSTTLQFRLRGPSSVTMTVYDMLGRQVATLLENEEMEEGENLVQFIADNMATGVYFCRIDARDIENESFRTVQTLKMLLLK